MAFGQNAKDIEMQTDFIPIQTADMMSLPMILFYLN